MLCILKISFGEGITGWIIAIGIDDARRKAEAAGESELAEKLSQMEYAPRYGKEEILPGTWLLAS